MGINLFSHHSEQITSQPIKTTANNIFLIPNNLHGAFIGTTQNSQITL